MHRFTRRLHLAAVRDGDAAKERPGQRLPGSVSCRLQSPPLERRFAPGVREQLVELAELQRLHALGIGPFRALQ